MPDWPTTFAEQGRTWEAEPARSALEDAKALRTGLGLIAVVVAGAAVLAWVLWHDVPESSRRRATSRLEERPVAREPLHDTSPVARRRDDRLARAPVRVDRDAMIDAALDPQASLSQRVRALWWLARLRSEEGVEVIERVLRFDDRAAVRAAAAEALGISGHEDVERLLVPLVRAPEATVARGAIRGLAATGNSEFASLLEELLRDPAVAESVRAQAAVSLSDLIGPEAQESLLAAFHEAESDEVAGAVLEGLGSLPFEQTASFFEAVLEDARLSDDTKAAALEALGDSTPDAAVLLYEVGAGASSPELRAAAVEALAFLEDAPGRPQKLLEMLAREAESDVRAQLYSTLALDAREAGTQAEAERVLSLVQSETSPDARLEGLRLLAHILDGGSREALAEPFEREMVPWLLEQAATSKSRYRRLIAVEALEVGATPQSHEALVELAGSADPEVAAAAAAAIATDD